MDENHLTIGVYALSKLTHFIKQFADRFRQQHTNAFHPQNTLGKKCRTGKSNIKFGLRLSPGHF